jgi:hypothetical protein
MNIGPIPPILVGVIYDRFNCDGLITPNDSVPLTASSVLKL